jgi:hypothetical protein
MRTGSNAVRRPLESTCVEEVVEGDQESPEEVVEEFRQFIDQVSPEDFAS